MAGLGPYSRAALILTGIVLGMVIVAGGSLWQARSRAPARDVAPAASEPSGSYTAPGTQS